jgi:hypothetical protein
MHVKGENEKSCKTSFKLVMCLWLLLVLKVIKKEEENERSTQSAMTKIIIKEKKGILFHFIYSVVYFICTLNHMQAQNI